MGEYHHKTVEAWSLESIFRLLQGAMLGLLIGYYLYLGDVNSSVWVFLVAGACFGLVIVFSLFIETTV